MTISESRVWEIVREELGRQSELLDLLLNRLFLGESGDGTNVSKPVADFKDSLGTSVHVASILDLIESLIRPPVAHHMVLKAKRGPQSLVDSASDQECEPS